MLLFFSFHYYLYSTYFYHIRTYCNNSMIRAFYLCNVHTKACVSEPCTQELLAPPVVQFILNCYTLINNIMISQEGDLKLLKEINHHKDEEPTHRTTKTQAGNGAMEGCQELYKQVSQYQQCDRNARKYSMGNIRV